MTPFFAGARVFDGRAFLAGTWDVAVKAGAISALAPSLPAPPGADVVTGGVLLPAFADAHVHMAFSTTEAVAAGGVAAVLDLGAPLDTAFVPRPPLAYAAAGPLLTAPGGYPTRSWGAGGFGLEIASEHGAREAVARLAGSGAAIVKVALEATAGAVPAPAVVRAVVEAAAGRGLRVAAHALTATAVREALDAGVTVLAHTPTERLPDDLVRRAGRLGLLVISTLRAFGARAPARENLAALAAAGCSVVYGTDLGNGDIAPGIDTDEVRLLGEALGGMVAALGAATAAAGMLTGGGGNLRAGGRADLVWVPRLDEPGDLAAGRRVWVAGAPKGVT